MSRTFRYNLILLLVALGTSMAAVAGWRFARASAPVNGPIVLLTIDALRADRLSVYGYSKNMTPALGALAAEATVFDRAYTHVPQTLPAHASLLSGRLPFDTDVRDNVGFTIPDSLRLVSTMLADRGYATGGVVSSFALRSATGISKGFAFFDDGLEPQTSDSGGGLPVVLRDGAETEKRAERWLSSAGTARAFLFLHLAEPHRPYTSPERAGATEPRVAPKGDLDNQSYDGEVAYADAIVGRLIAYLKKQQLYDESTIIVVGSHGESLGAHGEQQHGLFVFEDAMRVPLIIKQPGSMGGGRRVADVVQHVDIVPTILDLAKAPAPSGLAGRSLRAALEGRALGPRIAYGESLFPALQHGWPSVRTVTDGSFRFVTGPSPMLFDLEADPGNSTDVSASHVEVAARLSDALETFAKTTDSPTVAAISDGDRDRFMALGYIGAGLFAPDLASNAAELPEDAGRIAETYRSAMRDVARRRWQPAIDRLRSLTRERASDASAWGALGYVADRAARLEIAVDAYRRALTLVPGSDDTRIRLSSALLRARRFDDARTQAEMAAASQTGKARASAYELLARIWAAKHDPGAARMQAQLFAEINPNSALPSFIEGRLHFDRAQFEEALVELDRAAELAKGAPLVELQWLRGESLVELDRQAEAEEAFLLELRHFPELPRAYVSLATLYQGQQRREDVESILTQLTSLRTQESFETAARQWVVFGDRRRAETVRAAGERELAAGPASPTQ